MGTVGALKVNELLLRIAIRFCRSIQSTHWRQTEIYLCCCHHHRIAIVKSWYWTRFSDVVSLSSSFSVPLWITYRNYRTQVGIGELFTISKVHLTYLSPPLNTWWLVMTIYWRTSSLSWWSIMSVCVYICNISIWWWVFSKKMWL